MDIRFIDDIRSPVVAQVERVVETGPSVTYLPASEFQDVLELLRTEKPPPGDEEV